MKAKIDYTQQNSKCRLCRNRDETINHIISKYNKLVLKMYKTRHDLIGKVIYWKLCRKTKSDNATKWAMHKPGSIQEILEILGYFEIQADHLIPTRIEKKKFGISGILLFWQTTKSTKKNTKRNNIETLGLSQKTKKSCWTSGLQWYQL